MTQGLGLPWYRWGFGLGWSKGPGTSVLDVTLDYSKCFFVQAKRSTILEEDWLWCCTQQPQWVATGQVFNPEC